MMTWNPQANELFLQALQLPNTGEQQAYLDKACAHDVALRAEVQALLDAGVQAGSFLEAPVAATELVATIEAPILECPGTMIGPYKLLEQIGEGGFGIVFMAEQTEPVQRKVALKVLKPGMDTRQVSARFEAERQALAMMDHPNIARVLDAGQTRTGRPYFVMDLVKGLPITDYCDQAQLTTRDRLAIFVSVCEAVQHAHHKGIIHRDLKPTNVLVTVQDGRALVKVIDFGIAKALGRQLTDKTLFTGFAQLIGTPLYMSPEQAALSNVDVDTRSDVYSLGVLLYELLTGTTPFAQERLREADYDEWRRIIREEEPPKPSTRISTLGQAASTVSTQRQSDPRRLSQLFRGELDWIVMKALEKDRNRRYESASAFAADVQHYLNDEPVLACPPSTWYRARKFTRRHRTALAVSGLVLLLVVSLGGNAGYELYNRAAQQTKAATDLDEALNRVEVLQGTGKPAEAWATLDRADLLATNTAPDASQGARRAALREQLAAAERDRRFIEQFEAIRLRTESEVNFTKNRFANNDSFPKLREAMSQYGIPIGVMKRRAAIARVQDRPEPVRSDLIAALDECLYWAPRDDRQTRAWVRAVVSAADHDPWRVRVRQAAVKRDAKTLESLARTADVVRQPPSFLVGVLSNALPRGETKLTLLRRIQDAHPADLWANLELAFELTQAGRSAEAVRYYTAALALRPGNAGLYLNRGVAYKDAGEIDAAIADNRHALTLAPNYSMAHHNLGRLLHLRGQLDAAIAEYREAIRLNPNYPDAHMHLGVVLLKKGLLDQAVAECRQAIQLYPDYDAAHSNLGLVLVAKQQWNEAVGEYRTAIHLNSDNAIARSNLGDILQRQGQFDDAIAEFRAALRIKKGHYTVDPYKVHCSLGAALCNKGEPGKAIPEFKEAIRLKPDDALSHANLGVAMRDKGLLKEASNEFHTAIRLDKNLVLAHYNLARLQRTMGDLAGAAAEYRTVTALQPGFAEAHCNLGLTLQQQGMFREALAELRRGQELASKHPHWLYPSAQWVRRCERMLELDQRLTSLLTGKATPANPVECMELGGVCTIKKLYRAAAQFYARGIDAQPALANGHRYEAACAAALAGCGQGADAAHTDERERARLRRRALDWLRVDLQAWTQQLDQAADESNTAARATAALQHWFANPALAGVREPKALAKLPDVERTAWQELWKKGGHMLAQARAMMHPRRPR